jgi:tetratricopeptide (TPR) repeat protein
MDQGAAHFAAGRLEAARAAYHDALILEPKNPRALSSLATIEIRRGDLAKARAHLQAAVKIDPTFVGAWRNLAGVCQDLDLWPEAAAGLERALALEPSAGELRLALAWALTALGQVEAALETYRPLARDGPWRWTALARIGVMRPAAISLDESRAMNAAARDESFAVPTRVALFFALGAIHEIRGEIDAAFDAYHQGNALQHGRLESGAPSETPGAILAAHLASARRVRETMSESFLARHASGASLEARPIFIVGMPRSGSTLIEQILASHPDVTALGESAILPTLLERQYPADPGGDFATPLSDLGRAYLEAVRARGWRRGRPVDKTLENYLHVGAIALMFPGAVILHAVRDPLDLGVACWRTLFHRGAETLYDLGEIGAEIFAYQALMDHWRRVLPGRVHDVTLEALTADPPRQIRALLEVCRLSWNDACLRHWDAAHPVRTASAAQVRAPITAQGVGRWRLYERHLGPLRQALSAGPTAP